MPPSDQNPFRDWLLSDRYGGQWVPVGRLGGWVDPATITALLSGGADAREAALSSSDWPVQFTLARPTGDELLPNGCRDAATFVPLIVEHRPHTRSGWLEPIQAFVLYWDLWPQHEEGNVTWFEDDDDGLPVAVARFLLSGYENRAARGTLEIRRDRLLAFCARFDFDLAIYDEQNVEAPDLPEDWREEERTENRCWRAWAFGALGERRAVLRCATLIEHPPLDQTRQPRDDDELDQPLRYPIGYNEAGNVVHGSHPPDEFLTAVFFSRNVLDRYYADARVFTVEASQVSGGRWSLPVAETEAGTIQAWLGDVADLPPSVQRHWHTHAVAPEGAIPEWRIRSDLFGGFADIHELGPVGAIKRAIAAANEAAEARYGVPLYRREIDAVHAQTIEALRIPANGSMDAFAEEVRALALLVVEHLNSDFLTTAEAPAADGTLNRLALLLADLRGIDAEQARELIGGLYAVQALRSTIVAHRTGERADAALQRAEISRTNLVAGFMRLAERAATSIDAITEAFAA